MAARQCVSLNRWLSAGSNFSIFARLFRLSEQTSNTRIHSQFSQFSHSSYLRCERRKETSQSESTGSTNIDPEQDNNPGGSPDGTADTNTNSNCKKQPGIELSMASTSSLKITVPDEEVEEKFRDVKEPTFVYYHKINFSSVAKKLPSNKLVPLLLRWLPRSLQRQFFSSVLTGAKKKAYLDKDFDEQEFYRYGGLAAMKMSDIILRKDLAALEDLVAGNLLFEGTSEMAEQIVSNMSPSSNEDLVYVDPGKVFIEEHSSQHGIVHLTLYALCKLNADIRESAMPSSKSLFNSQTPLKVIHLALRRIACTFQQHYQLDAGSSPRHSQWKASEFAVDLDVLPLMIIKK